MNAALFGHLWRSNRGRLLIVAIALAAWGTLMPIRTPPSGGPTNWFITSSTA